jgi:hypothetical protein
MQTHRIIAVDWQVKTPSAGRLKAIVLPLEEMGQTQQYSCVGNKFVVESTYGCYSEDGWCFNTTRPTFEQALEVVNNWGNTMRICTPEGVVLYDPNYYQKGDCLYLAEEWNGGHIKTEWDEMCPDFILKSVHPNWTDNWQPAETMPEDAAIHWFYVEGVRVVLAKNVVTEKICPDCDYRTFKKRWNAAYPNHPWNNNRHVILLDIEKHATTNPK